MTKSSTQLTIINKEALKRDLKTKLNLLYQKKKNDPCAERVDYPLSDTLHPLSWLYHQTHPVKSYWMNREATLKTAGIGSALSLSPSRQPSLSSIWTQIADTLNPKYPLQRFYGGFRFDATQTSLSPEWQPFESFRLTLPLIELYQHNNRSHLAINLVRSPHQTEEAHLNTLLEAIESLSFNPAKPPFHYPKIQAITLSPSQSEWQNLVAQVAEKLAHTPLQKAVLARKVSYTLSHPLEAIATLYQLEEKNPDSFRFGFWHGAHTFFGATPERLFLKEGAKLYTEAIAGTRPRGKTPSEDETFAQDLRNSQKEQKEHQWVVQMLQNTLPTLCESLTLTSQPQLLKLSQVQHLCTPFQARLKDTTTLADLLEKLHPTPAVGGSPKKEALDIINTLEPFDRGWYAGTVGWVGSNAAEFVVAIRSALVHQNTLSLYSGSGIVKDSQWALEWDELDYKIKGLTQLLTHDSTHTHHH